MKHFQALLCAAVLTAVAGCEQKATTPTPPPLPAKPDVVRAKAVGVPIPDGGEAVFDPSPEAQRLNKGPEESIAKFELVDGQATGFQQAIRCQVSGALPEKPWYAQVSTAANVDLMKGDTVLLSFWARTTASDTDEGTGEFLVYFGIPAAEGTAESDRLPTSYNQMKKVGSEWKQFLIPMQIAADYTSAPALLNLDFGYAIQTLEFSGIQAIRYADKSIDELPSSEQD